MKRIILSAALALVSVFLLVQISFIILDFTNNQELSDHLEKLLYSVMG